MHAMDKNAAILDSLPKSDVIRVIAATFIKTRKKEIL